MLHDVSKVNRSRIRMCDISFESEEHNIYDPFYSSVSDSNQYASSSGSNRSSHSSFSSSSYYSSADHASKDRFYDEASGSDCDFDAEQPNKAVVSF